MRDSCFRLFVNFPSASQILSHFLTSVFVGRRGALHLPSAARLRLSGDGKEQKERRERTGADGKAPGEEGSGTTLHHHLGRGPGRSGGAAGTRSAPLYPSPPLGAGPAPPRPSLSEGAAAGAALPHPRRWPGQQRGRRGRGRGRRRAGPRGAGKKGEEKGKDGPRRLLAQKVVGPPAQRRGSRCRGTGCEEEPGCAVG